MESGPVFHDLHFKSKYPRMNPMNITINGQKKSLASSQNLEEIVKLFSLTPGVLIAEVNGTIIKKNQWNEINVNDGDTIELVGFVGGG